MNCTGERQLYPKQPQQKEWWRIMIPSQMFIFHVHTNREDYSEFTHYVIMCKWRGSSTKSVLKDEMHLSLDTISGCFQSWYISCQEKILNCNQKSLLLSVTKYASVRNSKRSTLSLQVSLSTPWLNKKMNRFLGPWDRRSAHDVHIRNPKIK
jgi:hypothetical protein